MFRRALLTAAFLAAGTAPTFAQGCDTSFTLRNESGSQINEIYFSPVSDGNWGRDRLGENVLPNGRQVSYRPSPGGSYDFRVVFENAQALELRNVNLCAVSTVRVSTSGISAE